MTSDNVTADISDDDLQALQRLRLARRNWIKREKEFDRAARRVAMAQRKLFRLVDECEDRGLDHLDPRALN